MHAPDCVFGGIVAPAAPGMVIASQQLDLCKESDMSDISTRSVDRVAEHIAQLGGEPDLSPDTLSARSLADGTGRSDRAIEQQRRHQAAQ